MLKGGSTHLHKYTYCHTWNPYFGEHKGVDAWRGDQPHHWVYPSSSFLFSYIYDICFFIEYEYCIHEWLKLLYARAKM